MNRTVILKLKLDLIQLNNSFSQEALTDRLNVIFRLVLHHSEQDGNIMQTVQYPEHGFINGFSFVRGTFTLKSETGGFKGFLSHLVNKSRLFLCLPGFLWSRMQLLPHH